MSDRDERWQGVRGGITRADHYPPDTALVTIEVVGSTGHIVGQAFLLSDQVRTRSVTDPLPMVLKEMVRKIDEALHS